ncbi:hypothetical protein [Microcoleus sp.]
MGASSMPMPYALCPMPYEHLMLLRKAISNNPLASKGGIPSHIAIA